ncbi:MAG: pyruvate kinase [Nevskiaceae bacterium]|nr:MAG: pyruvate kinase [Nevskiaceae bacterium]TBR74432.1 MAG: pyruvate kinase [Nevskiaceae bacterium]
MTRRRTKIVATLGPATDSPAVIRELIDAGCDVVRLNFSHGSAADHARRARIVRSAAAAAGRDVGILADLQGPKIRIEGFAEGPVQLTEGQSFVIDTAMGSQAGDVKGVGCSYQRLPDDVKAGDSLLLNDGAIELSVAVVHGSRIETTVRVGGRLSDRKGLNKKGGGLSAAALTDKDREDLHHAVALDADFIAVSFPRSAADMAETRELMAAAGGHAALVAKIERAEALPELEAIIAASDAVMVARGDLGVEIGDAELPAWQKRIITAAREDNRLVITATQMMESMIASPIPTRAEIMDVANAVLDGTDAVMLSAETAIGKYPVKTVAAMARVCRGAEAQYERIAHGNPARFAVHFERIDEAVARATAWAARHMKAAAIVALTESGATALMMSRGTTQVPIFALTPHERTRRRMALCSGVYPYAFEPADLSGTHPSLEAIALLRERGVLQPGDRVLVTRGEFTGPGGTNTMKILSVPE